MTNKKYIVINNVKSDFEREPLIRPFGFKGGYLTEIWQTISRVDSSSGSTGIGLCSQSVLWSDASVFRRFSEAGGNALMYAMTEYALQLIRGQKFSDPVDFFDDLWKEVWQYGRKITGHPELRETFALNALVGVDNALWLLYAKENNLTSFDEMIPLRWRPAVSYHNNKVASIPLVPYGMPAAEIKQLADDGCFFMKIKLGQPGTQEEMLEKDKARLAEVHQAIGDYRTSYTENGKLPYYFDANGRYEKKETLLQFLDYAGKIGAFDQIAMIEEPFPEESKINVGDIPVRIAADESAHTDKDVLERIQMGYKAIALKPIAKTLSMTLKIADVAWKHNVPCFCADLTVNPILVDWNKNIAARLRPFPGMETGLLETNGHQNYKNWKQMESHHPNEKADWRKTKNGVFELNEEFYKNGGGVFGPYKYHMELLK